MRRTLLAAARRARVRIGHPCRGEGVCGRCGVEVLSGGERLLPPDAVERQLLFREAAGPTLRMSCLAEIAEPGPIVIRVGGATRELMLK